MSKPEATLATKEEIERFNEMKNKIRKEMKTLYKTAENAFAEMDFNGNGYIEEQNFFQTLLSHKLPYDQEEILKLFEHEKWFIRAPEKKLRYELFK